MPEEKLPAFSPDALDFVENGFLDALEPQPPVIGQGKTVRLVADFLDEMECRVFRG